MKRPQKPSIFTLLIQSVWRDQSGFSLAEVLVAAGMVGVLSLGVTQLMQSSKKTEKRLGQQVNLVSLEGDIASALRDPVACSRTFRARNTDTGATPTGFDIDGSNTWVPLPDNRIYRGNSPNQLNFSGPNNTGGEVPIGTNVQTWGTIIEPWVDASSNTGVYGSGANMVSVLDINYRVFYDGSAPFEPRGYGDAANWSNSGNLTAISATDSSGYAVIRVTFTRGNYARFDGMTTTEQQALSNNITSGPFRVVKFFPVRVRIDTATGEALRCITSAQNAVAEFCQSMGGFYDEGDGRCKNVKVSDSDDGAPGPTVPGVNGPGEAENNEFAFAAQRTTTDTEAGKIIAESGLAVGYEDDPNDVVEVYTTDITYNGAGNGTVSTTADFDASVVPDRSLMVQNDIIADRDIFANRAFNVGLPNTLAVGIGDGSFGRDVRIQRDNFVERALNVGAPTATANAAGNAAFQNDVRIEGALNVGGAGQIATAETVDGRILVRNKITLAQNAADTTGGTALHVGSGNSYFVNATREVRINAEGLMSFRVTGGNEQARIRTNGEYSILEADGATNATRVGTTESGAGTGDGTGTYRPIRIYNQSTATSTMTFTNGSSAAVEVPTKEWVRRMVFGSLENNTTLVTDVVNNVVNYAQHNTLDSIRSAICGSIRLPTYGNTSTCSWSTGAGTCTCQNTNCGRSGSSGNGVQVCNSINLAGTLTANVAVVSNRFYTVGQGQPPAGYMRAGIMQALGSTGSNGFIYSSNNIDAENRIRTISGNIQSGNQLIAQTRVCSEGSGGLYYCYTKFGKNVCLNGGFMIGIAYGHPICAVSGGGGAATVGRY